MSSSFAKKIDWVIFLPAVTACLAGIVTMSSFAADDYFFVRQLSWLMVASAVFFAASLADWRFLKSSKLLFGLFVFSLIVLGILAIMGKISKGAQSWFSLGGFSFQPSDFVKIIIVAILAKYFSRRHIEISQYKHIFISAIYAAVPFVLIAMEPDFGSAMIIGIVWFGMLMASGISRKYIFSLILVGAVTFAFLWVGVFKPYQKQRIITFIYPASDSRGAGYNALQSQIAVGSGRVLGKGIGSGTQSRLLFLPEYQTDFIFAAFVEEWGFLGAIMLFALYALIIFRILSLAFRGATNFETLFCMGIAVFLASQFFINTGMNVGILPVTGITLPFMSYGGSHLVAEFLGIGIVSGMRKYARAAHRDYAKNEFIGPQ